MRRFDFSTLKIVVAVASNGSFSSAASSVNLTVGAVSKRITDLELYLGTALFYRHARGVIPTSAGVILAERASHMLIAFEDMRTEINKRSDDTKELASSPPTPELRRTASSQP